MTPGLGIAGPIRAGGMTPPAETGATVVAAVGEGGAGGGGGGGGTGATMTGLGAGGRTATAGARMVVVP